MGGVYREEYILMNGNPFTIAVPQTDLDDLQQRLAQTRWPDELPGSGWDSGSNLTYMKELVSYWQTTFDWRKQEHQLNAFPQFRVTIDGMGIHFLHVRGKGPRRLPLILTNGWPSSFVELLTILPRLTDPASFGGDPVDGFDVVIPSLPGWGFSDRPKERGITYTRIANVWSRLMSDVLGYPRFGAYGSDIGAIVTSELGRISPHQIIGLHLPGMMDFSALRSDAPPLSEQERAYFAELERWMQAEGGYMHIQRTKPQTLAYGLNDSPAGLAAWIVEKFRSWSDCDGEVERRFTKEELLTNISLYWFTQTIPSSIRRYYENEHTPPTPWRKGECVEVPCAITRFENRRDHLPQQPRALAERVYNVVRWTQMPRGGHFPALEEPELLVEDLRVFFRPLRE
jgi:pimeloyl-ACP methyl ester carboxylesterase